MTIGAIKSVCGQFKLAISMWHYIHATMVVDDMKLLPKVEKGSVEDGVQI